MNVATWKPEEKRIRALVNAKISGLMHAKTLFIQYKKLRPAAVSRERQRPQQGVE